MYTTGRIFAMQKVAATVVSLHRIRKEVHTNRILPHSEQVC